MSGPDSSTETLVVEKGAEKPDGEKLQKVLARMGYGSRRKPVSYTHLTLPTN